jgi:predicted protein tyrosine phosphatase
MLICLIVSYDDTIINMNNKHRKTLQAIFQNPILASILWRDVETLFEGLGAMVEEAEGSRVAIELNGIVAVFHRPHPRKEMDKGAVKSVRRFLIEAGIGHD